LILGPKSSTWIYASTGAHIKFQGASYDGENYYSMELTDSRTASASLPIPGNYATSAVVGDASVYAGNRRSANGFVSASGNAGNYAEIGAYLFGSYFALSPMTELSISTDVDLAVDHTASNEVAFSLVHMYILDEKSAYVDWQRYQLGTDVMGRIGSAHYVETFNVKLQNSSASQFDGSIAVAMRADAYINAVPELPASALLSAGLLIVVWVGGKSRERRNIGVN